MAHKAKNKKRVWLVVTKDEKRIVVGIKWTRKSAREDSKFYNQHNIATKVTKGTLIIDI
jgi:hypothetical protein